MTTKTDPATIQKLAALKAQAADELDEAIAIVVCRWAARGINLRADNCDLCALAKAVRYGWD